MFTNRINKEKVYSLTRSILKKHISTNYTSTTVAGLDYIQSRTSQHKINTKRYSSTYARLSGEKLPDLQSELYESQTRFAQKQGVPYEMPSISDAPFNIPITKQGIDLYNDQEILKSTNNIERLKQGNHLIKRLPLYFEFSGTGHFANICLDPSLNLNIKALLTLIVAISNINNFRGPNATNYELQATPGFGYCDNNINEINDRLRLHSGPTPYQSIANIALAVEALNEAIVKNPTLLSKYSEAFRRLNLDHNALPLFYNAAIMDANNILDSSISPKDFDQNGRINVDLAQVLPLLTEKLPIYKESRNGFLIKENKLQITKQVIISDKEYSEFCNHLSKLIGSEVTSTSLTSINHRNMFKVLQALENEHYGKEEILNIHETQTSLKVNTLSGMQAALLAIRTATLSVLDPNYKTVKMYYNDTAYYETTMYNTGMEKLKNQRGEISLTNDIDKADVIMMNFCAPRGPSIEERLQILESLSDSCKACVVDLTRIHSTQKEKIIDRLERINIPIITMNSTTKIRTRSDMGGEVEVQKRNAEKLGGAFREVVEDMSQNKILTRRL
jgi:hypothetical protein